MVPYFQIKRNLITFDCEEHKTLLYSIKLSFMNIWKMICCIFSKHHINVDLSALKMWKQSCHVRMYFISMYSYAHLHHFRPILVSKSHFESDPPKEPVETEDKDGDAMMKSENNEEECEWVVQPMRWGLIPHWHQGDIKNVGYNTINARSDTMREKPIYKRPLEKGRRCVVLVEG